MSEQEIIRRLEFARRRAEERKNKRAKTIYVVCFVIAFLIMNFVMEARLIESLLVSVFGGGILMYVFLVAFSVLTVGSKISFPEDQEVQYWEDMLREIRGRCDEKRGGIY